MGFGKRLISKRHDMDNYQITEAKIWAYISKQADEKTVKEVEQWRNSAKYDEKVFRRMERIHLLSGLNPENINLDINKAKGTFFQSVSDRKIKMLPWRNVLKYAALFALLFFTSFYSYHYLKDNNEIIWQTSFGENKQIELPDKSMVWLNSSSKLIYKIKSPRTMYLEGEAYFEVRRDTNNPFTVRTEDNLKVTVLGTSFNVKSYAIGNYTETVLVTGKVSLSLPKMDANPILMIPNEKITYLKNEKKFIKSKLVSTKDITSWRKGKIQFKNKSFHLIANDLFLHYNVRLKFDNEKIANTKFTGVFDRKTPIEEILKSLQLSREFEYIKIKNQEWLIK